MPLLFSGLIMLMRLSQLFQVMVLKSCPVRELPRYSQSGDSLFFSPFQCRGQNDFRKEPRKKIQSAGSVKNKISHLCIIKMLTLGI